jgi:hypothetical protein
MNKKQKGVAIITAVVLGFMLLFPPFFLQFEGGGKKGEGYAFISPPPTDVCSVDIATLFIQYLITITIGVILFYVFKGGINPANKIQAIPPKKKRG